MGRFGAVRGSTDLTRLPSHGKSAVTPKRTGSERHDQCFWHRK